MNFKNASMSAALALITSIAIAGSGEARPKVELLSLHVCTPSGTADGVVSFGNVNHHLAMNQFTPVAGNSNVLGEIGPGNFGNFTSLSETIEGSDTCNGPFVFLTSTSGQTIYAVQPQGGQAPVPPGPINVTFRLNNFYNLNGSPFVGATFNLARVDLVTYPSADQVYGSSTYNLTLNGLAVGFNAFAGTTPLCPSGIPTTPPPCNTQVPPPFTPGH